MNQRGALLVLRFTNVLSTDHDEFFVELDALLGAGEIQHRDALSLDELLQPHNSPIRESHSIPIGVGGCSDLSELDFLVRPHVPLGLFLGWNALKPHFRSRWNTDGRYDLRFRNVKESDGLSQPASLWSRGAGIFDITWRCQSHAAGSKPMGD